MSFCGYFFIALTTTYPFTCRRTPWLLPNFENYKVALNVCSGFCVDIHFLLIWANTKENNCRVLWFEYIQCCKKSPNCFPKWLYQTFSFSPAMNRSSCCFTPLTAFDVVSVWILTILMGV